MKPYEEPWYAETRLVDSYMWHDNQFQYVTSVGRRYIDLQDSTGEITSVPLKEFDPTPPKLGYVNSENMSVFVTRKSVRRYKQGLTQRNVGYLVNSGLERYFMGTLRNFPYSLKQAVTNEYPSLEDCADNIFNLEYLSRAFSRRFSMYIKDKKPTLAYKGRDVGIINDQNLNFKLDSGYEYLNDILIRGMDDE